MLITCSIARSLGGSSHIVSTPVTHPLAGAYLSQESQGGLRVRPAKGFGSRLRLRHGGVG